MKLIKNILKAKFKIVKCLKINKMNISRLNLKKSLIVFFFIGIMNFNVLVLSNQFQFQNENQNSIGLKTLDQKHKFPDRSASNFKINSLNQFKNPDYLDIVYKINIKNNYSNLIEISPDGRFLAYIEAIGSNPKFNSDPEISIILWSLQTGSIYKILPWSGSIIQKLIFSPSGKYLAVAGGINFESNEKNSGETISYFKPELLVWDINTEEIITRINYEEVFIAENRYSYSNHISIKNPADWPLIWTSKGGLLFTSILFSPDETFIALGDSAGEIKIFDLHSGELKFTVFQRLMDNRGSIPLFFSPDGNFLVFFTENNIKLFHLPTGLTYLSLELEYYNYVERIIARIHKSLIIIAVGPIISIFSFNANNEPFIKFEKTLSDEKPDVIKSLDISQDGSKLVTGGEDRTVKIWDIALGKVIERIIGHSDEIQTVRFSPDSSMIISASKDQSILFFNLIRPKIVSEIKSNIGRIADFEFFPNGSVLALATQDRSRGSSTSELSLASKNWLSLWDTETGSYLGNLPEAGEFSEISISPDGTKLVSVGRKWNYTSSFEFISTKDTITLWDISSWTIINETEFIPHQTPKIIEFSPNGSYFVVGAYESIKGYNSTTGNSIFSITITNRTITDLSFSPNGSILAFGSELPEFLVNGQISGYEEGIFGIINTNNLTDIQIFRDSDPAINSVDFSPDGSLIAIGTTANYVNTTCCIEEGLAGDRVPDPFTGAVRIWDVNSRTFISTLQNKSATNSVTFSPDGKTLASSVGYTYSLWDVENSAPGHIELWNLTDYSLIQNITTDSNPIKTLSFSRDGNYLAASTYDDSATLYVFDVSTLPFSIDHDLDSIPSEWEDLYGLDKNNFMDKFEDPDNDGLMNSMEHFLNTNPLMFDTDGNGISDAKDKGFLLKITTVGGNKGVFLVPSRGNDGRYLIIFISLFSLISLLILFGFLYKKKKRQSIFSIAPMYDMFNTKGIDKLRDIYHKLLVGLENAKQYWLSKYPEDEIEYLIEKQTSNYSVPINIFPEDIRQELKTDLRGRSVLILVELAYNAPNKSYASHVSDSLKIPLSTVIFEVKKLLFLQYLQLTVTPDTLQDNRFSYYILTPKGILFLHLLKESVTLSIQHMKNGEISV